MQVKIGFKLYHDCFFILYKVVCRTLASKLCNIIILSKRLTDGCITTIPFRFFLICLRPIRLTQQLNPKCDVECCSLLSVLNGCQPEPVSRPVGFYPSINTPRVLTTFDFFLFYLWPSTELYHHSNTSGVHYLNEECWEQQCANKTYWWFMSSFAWNVTGWLIGPIVYPWKTHDFSLIHM